MQFKKEGKDSIMQCLGEVLKKSYGEDILSVLTITDYPMPEVFKELTPEQNKLLEDRFSYCITEAALKDTFKELQDFLKDILERLKASFSNLRDAGYKWLTDYPCDDKRSFLNFGVYLTHASIFGVDAKNFFRKFTYTQKHSKKPTMVKGEPVFYSLYSYSPISSSEYVPEIFSIEEYGEQYKIVANLYIEIIYVLNEAYKYVMSVDQQAAVRKFYPAQCKKSLDRCVEEVLEALGESAINKDVAIPTPDQIQYAKNILSPDIIQKIFSLDIPTLSTTLYHEVQMKSKIPFGILVYLRIEQSKGMNDIEYAKVFNHIKDPIAKLNKATEAKLLLEHIGDFKQLKVKREGQICEEKVDKGTIACMFYIWTGTKMSQSAFLKKYYCVLCKDKEMHVAQNTLSLAFTKFEKNSPLLEAFRNRANEIICGNKETTAAMVSMRNNRASQERVLQCLA